jgi:probable blue pigment (indigoidine) exporter
VTDPMPPAGSPWRDLGWLVVLGILWGSAFPIIRAGLLAGAAPFAYGAARFGIAAAAMGVIALATRDHRPDRRTLILSALYGGVFVIAGYAAFLYTGEEYVTGGLASIFVATAPLWSVVFSRALIGTERIGTGGALGLVAGFAGVLVLLVPEALTGERNAALGGLLALAAVLVFVIGSILMKRSIATATGPSGLTVQFATASALLALLAFSPVGSPSLPFNGTVIATLLWLAAVPSVIGYTIYFYLHHRVGPTRANLVAYVNPTVAVLVGIAVFGEAVTLNEVAGFALVIVGLLLLHRRSQPADAGPVSVDHGPTPGPGR